ncbi:hypothetical protein [Aeromonas enteropelogenes]|uniref:hypothetical protein n=1 Tax=Aeromonas enteropelogenes TaxID=29489 RepID=UPI0038D01C67
MKILNIEVHCFTNKNPTITNNDAYKIMEELKEFELFPQVFQDVAPTGIQEQRFMFTNGVTGLTIRCQRDRLILVHASNPNVETSDLNNLHDILSKLKSVMKKFIETLNMLFSKEHKFHRLAIVTRHIELEKYDQLYSRLDESTAQNLPWIESKTNELSLRMCHRFEAESEIFNSVTTINDGMIDAVSNTGLSISASPCILFEVDINTLPENIGERFDINNYDKYQTLLIEKQANTLSKVKKFIEGN